MQLSKSDELYLRRLRKKARGWKTLRLLVLSFSLFCMGTSLYLGFFWRAPMPIEQKGWDLFDSYLFTMHAILMAKAELLLYIGVIGVGWVMGNWRGNPTVMILLRIVDELVPGSESD